MKIQKLKDEMLGQFIDYCKKYSPEHDESFTDDEELTNFKPDKDNPTYVILDDKGSITGAASLMINSYFKQGRKGRFRIFHSIEPHREAYELMHKSMLPHTEGIDRMYLFIPEKRDDISRILKSIGFNIERYSYLMTRSAMEIPDFQFPSGFNLREFKFGRDEKDWCTVRNEAFKTLAGAETPMTPDMISRMEGDDNLDGGMMLLYHGEKPVGLIRTARDSYEDLEYAYIGPIAVIPAYQGMGLGRNLLRAGLRCGKDKGLSLGLLTVNAENGNALGLYLKEGFEKEKAIVCFNYDIKK